MGIFDDLYDELSGVVKKGADSCKQTVSTAEQERIIRKMSAEIGNLVLVELDEGRQFGPAIMERYDKIIEARKVIEDIKATEPEPTRKICPSCGKSNSLDVKYCGFCGWDMDVVPEPEVVETEEEE